MPDDGASLGCQVFSLPLSLRCKQNAAVQARLRGEKATQEHEALKSWFYTQGVPKDVLEGRQAREAKSIESFRPVAPSGESGAVPLLDSMMSRFYELWQANDVRNDDPAAVACHADMFDCIKKY